MPALARIKKGRPRAPLLRQPDFSETLYPAAFNRFDDWGGLFVSGCVVDQWRSKLEQLGQCSKRSRSSGRCCCVFGVSTEVEKFRESRGERDRRGIGCGKCLHDAFDRFRTNCDLQDRIARTLGEEVAQFSGRSHQFLAGNTRAGHRHDPHVHAVVQKVQLHSSFSFPVWADSKRPEPIETDGPDASGYPQERKRNVHRKGLRTL